MLGRYPHLGDAVKLRDFCCATTQEDWDLGVERAARRSLQFHMGAGTSVAFLRDGDGEGGLDAVVHLREFYEPDDMDVIHLVLAAIRVELQEQRYGSELIFDALDQCAQMAPGGRAVWWVHRDNTRAHKVSEAAQAVKVYVEDCPDNYQAYMVGLTSAPS